MDMQLLQLATKSIHNYDGRQARSSKLSIINISPGEQKAKSNGRILSKHR